jgi:hypothetical protein
MIQTLDLEEKIIDELKEKYLKEVVHPSFPFIKYFGGSSWGKQSNQTTHVSFSLPTSFVSFKNEKSENGESEYYFSKSTSFIHYTTLKNAINILNDGFFRLNSLSYMDDPQELLYAGHEILGNYSKDELNSLKENVFCISRCEYDEEKNPEIFDQWRFYGDNGSGVGLVFKFTSEVEYWNNHYLSKIYYGNAITNETQNEESTKKFRIFRENHDKFIQEHEGKVNLLSSQFGKKGKIPEWIAIFLAFHKSSLYAPENEIRLLKQNDKLPHSFTFNNKLEKTLFDNVLIKTRENLKKIDERSQNIVTNTIKNLNDPVWIREMTKSNPAIDLQKILIGYRQKNNFKILKNTFKEGFLAKNGFDIDVELSDLAKAFQN